MQTVIYCLMMVLAVLAVLAILAVLALQAVSAILPVWPIVQDKYMYSNTPEVTKIFEVFSKDS